MVNYYITATPDDATSWKTFPASLSKYLFTGLVPGICYSVKYSLVGVRNQEVISDVVRLYAQ